MPTIDTGILEDDFCENFKALLETGNKEESWGLKKIEASLPLQSAGPFPAVYIQWIETADGDSTTMTYPAMLYDTTIKARIILVLTGHQQKAVTFTNRKFLRLIANYIKRNPQINGYCNTIRPPRLVSGEQLFTNSGGFIFSDGAIEIDATVSLSLTQSS